MFVPNGASWEAMKDLFSGMWSEGNGPVAAKLDKFNAVITVRVTQ